MILSICSATAIEEVQKVAKTAQQNGVHIVYFYCSFQLSASQSLQNLLGALLVQLYYALPEISGELKTCFQKKSPPTPDNLIQLILKYGSRAQKLYIIVDAINESNEADAILKSLMTILEGAENVYVMTTGTSPPSTPCKTRFLKEIMKPSSNRDDIRAFVNLQLELQPALRRLPLQTKLHVSNMLSSKADGM